MAINTANVQEFIEDNRASVYMLLHTYFSRDQPFLLRSDLIDGFTAFCATDQGRVLEGSVLGDAIELTQEAALQAPWIYLAVRPDVGRWTFFRIHAETMQLERVSVARYQAFKESLIEPDGYHGGWPVEIDFGPFSHEFPRLREVHSIGRGLEFLNRQLSGQLLAKADLGLKRLVSFLSLHTTDGRQLMLNPRLDDPEAVRRALRDAQDLLKRKEPETKWSEVEPELLGLGLEPGMGTNRRPHPREPAAPPGSPGGPGTAPPREFSGPHPDDLQRGDHLAPRLLRPVRRAGPAGHRRPGGLHPGPGAGSRERRCASRSARAGAGRRAADPGRDPADPRSRGNRPATSAWNRSREPRTPGSSGFPSGRRAERSSPSGSPASRSGPTWSASPSRRRREIARRAGRRPRPHHRQLLGRQPGGQPLVAAAGRHPVQHRPRPGEDQVSPTPTSTGRTTRTTTTSPASSPPISSP